MFMHLLLGVVKLLLYWTLFKTYSYSVNYRYFDFRLRILLLYSDIL